MLTDEEIEDAWDTGVDAMADEDQSDALRIGRAVEAAVLAKLAAGELPAPDTHCWDEDTQQDCWSYSREQLIQYGAAKHLLWRAEKADAEAAAYARGHRHGHDEAMEKFSAEPIGYAENEELDAQREYPHNVRHMAIWYDQQDATTPLYTRTTT